MNRPNLAACAAALLLCTACRSIPKEFVRIPAGRTALTHVRLIDGTGAPAREDQTIVIAKGSIIDVGNGASVDTSGASRILDLRGFTVIPGLVGMHDHLFYALPPAGTQYREMLSDFPAMYLAAGVTTIRTAGALDLPGEVKLRRRIDQGEEAGPHLYLTSAYLDARADSPEDPALMVRTVKELMPAQLDSVQAYRGIRGSELAAIVRTAHVQNLRVTGHLCAVGFSEAADLGIDNLEHGLVVDTEFYSRRRPGTCPDQDAVVAELGAMDVQGRRIQDLIGRLVKRHVAVTSTLAVFEAFSGSRLRHLDRRPGFLLAPALAAVWQSKMASGANDPAGHWERVLRNEMAFERAFVRAGGLLLAGADPTGWGGILAGFGDQREVELLVEAGFTPVEAIRIATSNGARFLNGGAVFGTVQKGMRADLVVVRGNPVANIRAVRNTEIVFKDGIGFDAPKMMEALAGKVGL